ncbi:hypothetical protein G9A89_003678 [Geosiphon pyriformis]|nr:hypothetical protein G9A89_003678 [Geosiphon pyriformis]
MEQVGLSVGSSDSVLAELGTWSGAKKKAHVKSVYSYSSLFKKPKKSDASGIIVDSSAGSLFANILQDTSVEHTKSWGSEMDSEENSVSKVSDIENMKNIVTKEMSYVNFNTFETNDMMNDATLRKTQMRTYVLEQPPKVPSFDALSDNDAKLVLLGPKFSGSYKLLLAESCDQNVRNFGSAKLFALDIKLSAISGKTNSDKLITIKKIFYYIDGFGRASTSLKFPGIIKSSFTSKFNLDKAKELAICEKIFVNDNLRKVNIYSDQKIIVKKIPVDFSKSAVESVFSKFGKIVSIKMQLISLWQKVLVEFDLFEVASLDSVQVVLAIEDKQSWIFRDWHRALLYTLPVGITAYDLSGLLELYGGRTCFIGHNPSFYVYDRCAMVCFVDKTSKLAAIGSVPVFKSVNLYWANLFLACCATCKQFGHILDACSMVTNQDRVYLANIYKKKQAPIICLVSFSGRIWAQVAGGSSFLLSSLSPLGTGPSSGTKLSIGTWFSFSSANPYSVSSLFNYLASLELLTNQVSDIVRKLSFVKLLLLAVFTSLAPEVNSNIVLDGVPELSVPFFSAVVDNTSGFSLSSSKMLTTKVDGLDGLVWKFAMCNIRGINVPTKQVDVVHWHISSENMISFITEIKLRSTSELWIKDKYDRVQIFTSGLNVGYLGAGVVVVMNNSLAYHVSKIEVVSGQIILVQLLFKSKLLVSVLSLYAGASAGIYFGQASKVNSIIAKTVNTSTFVVLGGNFNECGSRRNTSFKFCSSLGLVNLFNGYHLIKAPMWCNLKGVERTIDYIFVSESLFFAVVKCWVGSVSDFFNTDHNAVTVSIGLGGLLDVQLNGLCKQANKNFAKIVKRLESDDTFGFNCLVKKWLILDADKALVLRNMVYADQKMIDILKYLSIVRKGYRKSKIYESKLVQEASIKAAIEKCMEKFCLNKNNMIRSVVLDYLVVNDELVLDPDGIKLNVDRIIEGWTRKYVVPSALSNLWACQYVSLNYVKDNVFSGVIDVIVISKLLVIVGGLSDDKAAGLFGILNKLWKHGGKSIMKCLLVLLNECLFIGTVPAFKFGVFHGDNFSVLKSIFTQVLVFAVGLVVEDALEKNKELWLVLQDMRKAYNSFVAKLDRVESNDGMSSFFAAEAFVNNIIWIKDCQASMQYALDIASNFFLINDIFINSKKTVTIPINQSVKVASLNINGQPISIAKRGKAHRYLGIFLSTEDLSRSSLAKTHSDVHFFANVVLRKAITDKQFLYLVSANALVRKGLKLKAGLSHDFPNAALHHSSLYGLKSFEQIQTESKLAAVITFSNASDILERLFDYKFLDLQVLDWTPLNPLQFPVKLHVNSVNNFLAGMVKIFLGNKLVAFGNRLFDKKGHFNFTSGFLHDGGVLLSGLTRVNHLSGLDILASGKFFNLHNSLHKLWFGFFEIFTDGSLKAFGFSSVVGSAAAYFSAINYSINIRVCGLMSFTLAKLQAVALALECVLFSSAVTVHFDSQAVIDTCVSELSHLKNLSVSWVKVKGHSGVCGNIKADAAAGAAVCSQFFLPIGMWKQLLIAENMVMSGNAHHFVRDLFRSICQAHWETGPGCDMIQSSLIKCVD